MATIAGYGICFLSKGRVKQITMALSDDSPIEREIVKLLGEIEVLSRTSLDAKVLGLLKLHRGQWMEWCVSKPSRRLFADQILWMLSTFGITKPHSGVAELIPSRIREELRNAGNVRADAPGRTNVGQDWTPIDKRPRGLEPGRTLKGTNSVGTTLGSPLVDRNCRSVRERFVNGACPRSSRRCPIHVRTDFCHGRRCAHSLSTARRRAPRRHRGVSLRPERQHRTGRRLQSAVSSAVTSLAYDRAGYGFSETTFDHGLYYPAHEDHPNTAAPSILASFPD